jgi:ribonuclease P/MRP protein subunit POP5
MVRFKNRFLLIHSYTPFEYSNLRHAIADNFGDITAAQITSSINLKYNSPATGMAIVRCAREHVRIVQAALFFMEWQGQVVHVSGTIKKSQIRCIELDQEGVILGRFKDDAARRKELLALQD